MRVHLHLHAVFGEYDFTLEAGIMNTIRIVGIALILAGALGLAYGGFSYTKATHQAKLGPIELAVTERQTVNVPVWAGIGAIVIGGALILVGARKR